MVDKSARDIVLYILMEILEKGTYSHIIINRTLSENQGMTKSDRAFITRLTEGVVERKIQIDYIINSISKTKVNKMKPIIRNIIRMGVYQIYFMDAVPDSAACNEAVKLAVKRKFDGLKSFVNGVLRNVSRNKENIKYPELKKIDEKSCNNELLKNKNSLDKIIISAENIKYDKESVIKNFVVKYSMPEWIIEKWLLNYGLEETKQILGAFLSDYPTIVRCNTKAAKVEDIIELLKIEGITVKRHEYPNYMLSISGYDYLEKINAFKQGLIFVQDIGSALVGEFSKVKQGDYVIDVCAAPGGKSIHMAELLTGTGTVDSRDISERKVKLIQANIDRMGIKNLKLSVKDALILDESCIEKADIVIADLPCSGLGSIGKKPEIKYRVTNEDTITLSKLQQDILNVVWQYIKPNGTLIYSTCTINKDENEYNVEQFIKNKPFKIIKQVQLLPSEDSGDGFFICVMKRT